MPRFRVRDLMINVGEGSGGICEIITNCGGVTELCVENTQGCAFTENCRCTIQTCGANSCGICTPCSVVTFHCDCTACSACSVVTNPCRQTLCTARSLCGRSFVCTPTFVETFPGELQVEHLALLKDELRATLEQVEAREKALSEQQQPQTLEQVDAIEKQLNEALKELKKRRAELQKRGQGGGE
jgi:hypothetical protein